MSPPDLDLLETRLAARLAAALSEPAAQLPVGVAERLRFAREQAVARVQRAPAGGVVGLGASGASVLGQFGFWWPRLGALLPVVVLIAGALVVSDLKQREQLAVATEIDSALLADDLPPAAYADPGFVAFLKLQQP
jgi:cobalamin biosynthesis protein CobD/CbiB